MTEPTLDDFVFELQRWGWSGNKYEWVRRYLFDTKNALEFLAVIDGGLELSPYAISEVLQLGQMATVGGGAFSG